LPIRAHPKQSVDLVTGIRSLSGVVHVY
jgi:hypothetical protein